MKIKCCINHIVVPLKGSYQMLVQDEVIEVPDLEAYPLLAKFSHAIVKVEETKKVIEKAEQTK